MEYYFLRGDLQCDLLRTPPPSPINILFCSENVIFEKCIINITINIWSLVRLASISIVCFVYYVLYYIFQT